MSLAPLWIPSAAIIENANITHYLHWLRETHNLTFMAYPQLWQWSVERSELFWESLWSYFDLTYSQKWHTVCDDAPMPDTHWFEGVRLNWAENILAKRTGERPMLLYQSENQPLTAYSWDEIYDQANRLAIVLRELGVERGDRVVAFLPNIPESIVSVLAVASIGAIWSSCSPDFGARSVLDRFTQIEPKVLIAVDGYQYNGKLHDRRAVLAELQSALPTLQHTILIPYQPDLVSASPKTTLWQDALDAAKPSDEMQFEQVAFNHPLWVLYSSGTTGLPKPIVHGHGGILLEHAKATVFHNDLKPSDRFFWYSSTGWMMWNYTIGALLSGATIILYNGSPAYPNMNVLWRMAEETEMTYFGTSAAYISACIKAEITPYQDFDLSKIRGVGSTGSPLTEDGFDWIYDNVNRELALESLSGGTDLCTAFVGGARTLPIYKGEIQGASLGADVRAFNEQGESVVDAVGELVIFRPMPSMPIYFWNDPDKTRYRASYFEMFPNVWRHGDWIKINERGGCIIYGRSDSTINRHGIRMGTSELYQAVEALPEILDSLVIDLELLGRESYLPLFVVLRDGVELTDELRARIKQSLRANVSPRHVPNDIFIIDEVPYTLSGKKMEVPIRKILLGHDIEKAANRGAMRNPQSLQFFINFAQRLAES